MSIKLFTNELSAVYDAPLRQMLISNFEITQDTFNDILDNQVTIEHRQIDIKEAQTTIESKIRVQDENMHELINILSDYDVPIAIVDGKVTRTEEGE
ncbi:hypothetical protein [Lactiplantibacillus plantarum]|uniref:hypothetical protein n=1 Tax=Lactiplantibacillus plantarum TaxID=1590 RepID=UPI0002B3F80B|nr:hypothetical protein [Lactiplantibacillus plantarum]AGE39908.1 Hypothetical protein zj316_2369 [Lactiplantibacillus plantarum ZJ316]MCB7150996.1 hypothetical protein [Lactiplantibacillus plantarum]MCB7171959.1 hypothetical protein [Lactiplantibacillus plantarum]MCS8622259.1 hypothetical protein [Lactiplantibacillus plantarum]QHM37911.1 hypothetical protein C7M36_02196 [Lactiplantibacillus plantarum]